MDSPESSDEVAYVFKVCLIGASDVGKTSLLLRYVDRISIDSPHYSTIGVDFRIKTFWVMLDSGTRKLVKLQIWDTAGQERFRAMIASAFRGAHAAVLVYDVARMRSFEDLQTWIEHVDTHAVPYRIILGNKCDLADETRNGGSLREVPADLCGARYPTYAHIETSAKTGERVEETFLRIGKELAQQTVAKELEAMQKDAVSPPIRLDDGGSNQRYTGNGCCGGTAKK